MKNFLIVPSLLSANFCILKKEINNVVEAGCRLIHFDVMDNHYVPNLTFGSLILKSIKNNNINVEFDVHLMVSNVDSLIPAFADLNVKFITIHPETTNHLDKTIRLIKEIGCGVGIALNPSTPLSCLNYVVQELDVILVMSVNPGFGGQMFLGHTLKKIQHVRKLINEKKKNVLLSVDGGINQLNIGNVIRFGADVVVIGSAIFHSDNYVKAIHNLKNIINE